MCYELQCMYNGNILCTDILNNGDHNCDHNNVHHITNCTWAQA